MNGSTSLGKGAPTGALVSFNVADLWLDPIPPMLRETAIDDLANGDVVGFLCRAQNTAGLALVWRNGSILRRLGLYERALLDAFTSTRANNCHWPLADLRYLFSIADRELLRAAGDIPPDPRPTTLYRGVAGTGRARRVCGLSWTSDLDQARWFAVRHAGILADPAVYALPLAKADVLAYFDGRQEREYVVLVPPGVRPRRVANVAPADDEKGV